MRCKDFEEYLMVKCMEDEPIYTDDMYPDVYVDWIQEQDIEEVIKWANEWHKEQVEYEEKLLIDLASEVLEL